MLARHTTATTSQGQFIRRGIISAILMAFAALCIPQQANAAQVIATVTGTVTYGIDGQTGGPASSSIFGFPPGTQMAGSPYTAVYTLDTTAGVPFDAQTPCINSRKSSGLNNTPVPKAEITINGVTYVLGTSTPTGVASYVQAYGAPASKPENSLVFSFTDSGPSPKTEALYTDISLNGLSQYVCRNWADAFSYTLQSSDQPSSGNFDAIVPGKNPGSSNQYSFADFDVKTVNVSGQLTTPHIFFASPTGTIDVTNTQQTVVVGQSIQLTAEPAGQPISWSVPNQTIGGYTPTSSSFQTAKVVPTNLGANSSAKFYWITSGTKAVVYSSQAGTVHATFIVQPAPTSSVTVTYAKPNPDWIFTNNGVLLVGFGNYRNPADLGIVLETKTDPGSGQFEWVQLIQTDSFSYTGGSVALLICQSSTGLDSGEVGYPSHVGGKFSDSPYLGLVSPFTKVERSFLATAYLMWRSKINNSLPVPLGVVTWGFDETTLLYNNSWMTPTVLERSATFIPNLQNYPFWQSLGVTTAANCKR